MELRLNYDKNETQYLPEQLWVCFAGQECLETAIVMLGRRAKGRSMLAMALPCFSHRLGCDEGT